MKKAFRYFKLIFLTLCFSTIFFLTQSLDAQAAADAKIHYLTLNGNTLSVLLECNGHFGLVDAGEDHDYPTGDDPRYPKRAYTETKENFGFEDQVIEYLHSVGVTTENFDFFIGTHAHSDHIGGADEVIREFHPKRVYTPEYHDAYFDRKWVLYDNLYIYDRMLEAADEVGASIILNFDPEAPIDPNDMPFISTFDGYEDNDPGPTQGKYEDIRFKRNTVGCPDFTLGDEMQIHIKNYKNNELYVPIRDANDMSLGVLVEANGKTAFITSDIENENGDEDRLINEVPEVDMITVAHHGITGNSYDYICHLSPEIMIYPGYFNAIKSSYQDISPCSIYETLTEQLNHGARLYPTSSYSDVIPAFVFNFDEELSNNIPEDFQYIGKLYESDTYLSFKDGRPYSFTGDVDYNGKTIHFEDSSISGVGIFQKEGSKWKYLLPDETYAKDRYVSYQSNIYYFDETGYMYKGWKKDQDPETGESIWYYFNSDGTMAHGWLNLDDGYYYMDSESGRMQTGLHEIDGNVYSFDGSGAMLSNCWVYFDQDWYYLGNSGAAVTGWLYDNGQWYYLNKTDYTLATGLTPVGDDYYYFDPSGIMYIGWIYDGVWYYATDSGELATGWGYVNGSWYYFDETGVMQTGWVYLNDTYYYMSDSGAMQTGLIEVHGKKYYMNGSGEMQTGWIYCDLGWCYATESGAFATGLIKIGNTNYCFDSSGVMCTGWAYGDGVWYYVTDSGELATGWLLDNGSWYFLDETGVMRTGWICLNGTYYYLSGSGAMLTGWIYDGEWYYASGSGAMQTGWLNLDGTWYYLNGSGVMQTGWVEVYGQYYYLSGSGAMLTGWIYDGKWYYASGSGAMQTGWLNLDGTWYYLNGSGAMLTGWIEVYGQKYYMNGSGEMQTGWIYDGEWYYAESSGAIVTNQWIRPYSNWYYMNEEGIMVKDTVIDGYVIDENGVMVS